ncbi:MAG: O-antigen ligase family protein [Erysipelotrichaceae bacterium]|nr:O-antigen ligase family protein [Erysipelotrichaceae bacterium]MCI9523616.1 O-antigen ligase family protein [Erysipelotrichaceae bacterium]
MLKNRILAFLHRKFDGYCFEEYMIMAVVCCMFLPFYISLTAVVVAVLYMIGKNKIPALFKQYPSAKWMMLFCILTFFVSLFHNNQLGALCSIGLIIVFLFILFYRSIITPRLFELITDACCIISLFCFAWALLEYHSIINSLDYEVFSLQIEDDPSHRVNSTFFNANYYAMMVEFLILICVYKMMNAKTPRRIVFYIITISCNLFGLYLSGCRTAWIPFLLTLPLMFLLNNHRRFFMSTLALMIVFGIMVLIDPEIFPRSDSFMKYLEIRLDIWQAALKGIQAHPLFGQGPLTYYHSYMLYGGPPTEHAHSVYLDPFLSFGIIGVCLIGIYFYQNGKEVYRLYKYKYNVRLFSLILAFILTVMIHGILDYTIFWVQTGLLFLLVLSASGMYFNQKALKNKI